MARYLPLLDTTLLMGVGAAFLLHTGRIQDSPRWVKRAGLQWVHRLLQEPTRLWRRYLLRNPSFMVQIAWQLLRERCLGIAAVKGDPLRGNDLKAMSESM